MKKIFINILLLVLLFVGNNVFAGEEACPGKWDSEFGCPGDLDKAIEKQQNSNSSSSSGGGCTYSEGTPLSSFLNGCKPKTVVGGADMSIEGGFKDRINKWIKNISLVLGIGAVGALVYAAVLLQLSGGEDEQIKKAKNIVKRTIIGFLLLISASGIIYIVINVMFGIGN